MTILTIVTGFSPLDLIGVYFHARSGNIVSKYSNGLTTSGMQDLLQVLKAAPKQGVYRLVDNEKKLVYIGYSSNIPVALIRNLDYDYSNCDILEVVTDKDILRLRCQFYKDTFKSSIFKDYILVNPDRVCGLKLHIDPINDFRQGKRNSLLLHVRVVYRGYYERTVGVFETYTELEEFVAANYSNEIYNIVYSNNELTKEYKKLYEKMW